MRVQIVSIVFATLVFAAVFEMVRRRYLRERYALLWLAAAFALLVLAIWKGLLTAISNAAGIRTPSNAFFVIAFAFLLLLLLHFSAVVSRLSDETRILAQRLSLLEQRQRSGQSEGDGLGDGEDEGLAAADDEQPDWASVARSPAERTRAGSKP
ncbi:MAG: DUF2304 domain-containing protein [Solirubrobacteraceae bacterium]